MTKFDNEILDNLPMPVLRVLGAYNCGTLGALEKKSPADLCRMTRMGVLSILKIEKLMQRYGKTLAVDPKWPTFATAVARNEWRKYRKMKGLDF